ncbi:hypothetical protein [Nocardioides sp. Kera G14]|uniref:hypothetical protein n=1 Tax=Nocardioides sp. Kera G14 TaxID=2884264 RepID=UPI001D11B784|nr:hypothetical protein [Nocardioides sp. Kera G14]UDY22823.1 hypothetical protein LH076_12190 [Nocardioides sp. Kera G14]
MTLAAALPQIVGALPLHGIGGARDLPIPRELAIAGAVAALVLSFSVLALAWRTPRYDEARTGRPAPIELAALVDSRAWHVVWRVVGMLLFLYTAMVAIFGKDLLTNPLFGIFYVWWWVALVPLSVLFGPVWKAISPVRTINGLLSRLSGNDPERGLYAYPEKLGHWPAAIGLFAFVWMELVYPYSTELGPVRLWCAVYVALMLVGGALWGNVFYARADPFEVYSSLAAKLSVWGRRSATERRLWMRSPLANLDTVVPRPGLVAVAAVLFGSTAFDSFKDSTTWVKFFQGTDFLNRHSWAPTTANFLALLGMCLLVGLIFTGATMATGVGPGTRRRTLPAAFAHSILPIIVAYVIAHYLSYLLEAGEATLIKASDPFSTGANWFGTANWSVDYYFAYHPTLLANIKVGAVVIGHVLGVVAAHDRSIKLLPKQHQVTGQLPLLFAMVGFTAGGLYLLFSA